MKISYLMYEPVTDLAELDRRMERLAGLGYQGIELVATHPLGYAAEEVLALSRQYRLPVVSLLSGWSFANEGLCLSSRDVGVRDRAVARLGEYVGWAARLGAVVVVGLLQGLRGDEPDEAVANDRIADCLRRVAGVAQGQGVSLVIEPVNHLQVGFNNTAAEAAAMVDRVGSPALTYMLDTIHMNIEERSIAQTIRAHGPRIRHFHLCETNGGPFGTGNLDFDRVLAALTEVNYQHYVSVKIYRKAGWDEAAQSAAAFLKSCGVRFR
ncbi:MAG TPA: sugar phosphate isomerase/epimerase family protein [Gemmataceae bacterium]|jgi:sugar phosphate isomerase/epimerase|nr:sugar phosphate isomerase/epimerase family protein [Gemmataceae bacterium]